MIDRPLRHIGRSGARIAKGCMATVRTSATIPAASTGFEILQEEVVSERYLTLYNRRVRFPTDHEHSFDVIGHPKSEFKFVVTFPFHSATKQLPGGYDPRKHADLSACAHAELSEEAELTGGSWVPLLDQGHPGIAEVKWCRNRFQPFLCIDPQVDDAPAARDIEEVIRTQRISIPELQHLMVSGDMLLPSVATSFMALDRLQQMSLIT